MRILRHNHLRVVIVENTILKMILTFVNNYYSIHFNFKVQLRIAMFISEITKYENSVGNEVSEIITTLV